MKGVVSIPLSQGRVALIDADDYRCVSQYKWSYTRDRGGKEYVVRTIQTAEGERTSQRLHRFLLGSPSHLRIDHKNGDGLDCRRTNLRYATPTQNQGNKRMSRNNTTGFKGVAWDKHNKKFIATICVRGKGKTLGRFAIPEDAARAYDAAARDYFREFALTNFEEKQ